MNDEAETSWAFIFMNVWFAFLTLGGIAFYVVASSLPDFNSGREINWGLADYVGMAMPVIIILALWKATLFFRQRGKRRIAAAICSLTVIAPILLLFVMSQHGVAVQGS